MKGDEGENTLQSPLNWEVLQNVGRYFINCRLLYKLKGTL